MNILGSTAPDWIPIIIPFTAIGGGFTSRIIWVVEHQKGNIVEDPNAVEIDMKLENALTHDLEQISNVAGQFEFTAEGLNAYKNWYRHQEEEHAKGNFTIKDPRFSGYNARRATHVKKIAMICSMAKGDELIIEVENFQRALGMLESVEQSMASVFSSVGRSQYSIQTDSVAEFIKKRGEVWRSELLRVLYYDVDSQTLEIVKENLTGMGVVKVTERDTKTGDYLLSWVG